MKKSGLITLTDRGLYCKRGDFYINPWKPVKKAVLTHAHADHTYHGKADNRFNLDYAPVFRIHIFGIITEL